MYLDNPTDTRLSLWVFMDMFPAMTINTDTLKISPEILSLIAELDEFKGAWRMQPMMLAAIS